MYRCIRAVSVVVGIAAVIVALHAYATGAVNCSDFASHAAAQRYHAANPDSGLDRDSDGNPCERLR